MATEALVRFEAPADGLLAKLSVRDALSIAEEAVLRAAIAEVTSYGPGETIIAGGVPLERSGLLVEGMVARASALPNGQRQITELHVPGDFVDLHGFLLKRIEHDVIALGRVRMAFMPHAALRHITETAPHLARLLWFTTLVDAAIQREKIVSIGRRSALERVAHLLCEVGTRLDAVGLVRDGLFDFPLTQQDIGDATGLTSIHVNRMLKRLRDEGAATVRSGRVRLHDRARLAAIADFDPGYLYLERRPR